MLKHKAKLFKLFVGFVSLVLFVVVWLFIPRDGDFFTGQMNGKNRVKQDLTISTDRKYKLVDMPQYFSDFNQVYNASSQKKMNIIFKILWYSKPAWFSEKLEECDKNMQRCEHANCIIINNRSLLLESNALIFDVNGPNFPRKPPQTPLERDQTQVWIFFGLESPKHYWYRHFRSEEWNSAFNWTMTYRLDSDIPHPYGVLLTNQDTSYRDYHSIFRAKKKFAVWLVSHCHAGSKRDDFVGLLQKYVQVDIYGACGKACLNESVECTDFIGKEYKFYLSFENSLCKDYITEKFFKYFPLDFITVQRGYSDYNSMLPNETYINAAKFFTVQELANFMTRLADNEDEYILYLKAKDRYVSHGLEWAYCNSLCDICNKLNNLERFKRSYNDIASWLEIGTCVNASDII